MSLRIGNYTLEKPLTSENAGFSRWGIGQRDGHDYFIKEFLSPIYPSNNAEIGSKALTNKRKICKAYEEKKLLLYNCINKCSDGNLLRIEEFFRYKSKYYIAMENINAISLDEVQKMPEKDKFRLCMILAHSLRGLHEMKIVHGDIKINNILFYRTSSGSISAKIIDFDTCFWEAEDISDPEELSADLLYMAPETFDFIRTEEGKLTTKTDVFAMGLVFHQIMTGELPFYDKSLYDYPFGCVLDGKSLVLSSKMSSSIMHIAISKMLVLNVEDRLNMSQVFELLHADGEPAKTTEKKINKYFSVASDL
ncbi:MAG: protein kinase [Lachnospiraceae bacterium]|nr:protein kinase [Lachnospiraceae bacterium]MDD3616649.1 protein kinase [Lachnospiraceae bacterium]